MNHLPEDFDLDLHPIDENLSNAEKAFLLLEGNCPRCFRRVKYDQNKPYCLLCSLQMLVKELRDLNK